MSKSTEQIEGAVERITFQGEDGYTIARLKSGEVGTVTLVGTMPSVREGENLLAKGEWSSHPKYGRQFKVDSYSQVLPGTVEGIERYLSSGLIKGVGPVSAKRIAAHFGESTLEIIDSDPMRLLEVPKLGRRRVQLIAEAWSEQRKIKDVMVFLQSYGITTGHAVKIFNEYGDQAIRLVRQNPYRLERDIRGIGFQTADVVARKMGIAESSPDRIRAGLRFLLNQGAANGDVYLDLTELIEQGKQLLCVDAELIPPALEGLRSAKEIISEQTRHYLPMLYRSEAGAAASLHRLLRSPGQSLELPAEGEIGESMRFAPKQLEAVELAMKEKVLVLTGGPGTGKTTVTKAILKLLEAGGLKVSLCSPTGRAAKRLSETAGRDAKTIHRLLEYAPATGSFKKGFDNPIEADALIVDEASMIDVTLMNALLRALPDRTRLLLVGDVDQLPSVGPGNVLLDIIDSGVIPVVRLTEIFRQAMESQIVLNAHRINQGKVPEIENRKSSDFFFLEERDPERSVGLILDLCSRRLPEHGNWDPVRDIQVLTPMYRGETGATNLNRRLQQTLNPGGSSLRHSNNEFKVGDKVLQVRNNYDKGVFNGDMGIVVGMDLEEERLEVSFGTTLSYEPTEIDQLILAYAISTHRSQGSEFPAVVIPVTNQHYVMLQRNLLYTAVTRAKKMIVLVGTKQALQIAVKNDKVTKRNSALQERLRAETTEVISLEEPSSGLPLWASGQGEGYFT